MRPCPASDAPDPSGLRAGLPETQPAYDAARTRDPLSGRASPEPQRLPETTSAQTGPRLLGVRSLALIMFAAVLTLRGFPSVPPGCTRPGGVCPRIDLGCEPVNRVCEPEDCVPVGAQDTHRLVLGVPEHSPDIAGRPLEGRLRAGPPFHDPGPVPHGAARSVDASTSSGQGGSSASRCDVLRPRRRSPGRCLCAPSTSRSTDAP